MAMTLLAMLYAFLVPNPVQATDDHRQREKPIVVVTLKEERGRLFRSVFVIDEVSSRRLEPVTASSGTRW